MSGFRSTLKAHSDFKLVYSSKSRFYRDGLVFYYRKAENIVFRYAISISKRFGCAVKRNKMRRRIKEIVRTSELLPANSEIIFGINGKCKEFSYFDLKARCDWAFTKIGKRPVEPTTVIAAPHN
jgi:ribonuclease P protein component